MATVSANPQQNNDDTGGKCLVLEDRKQYGLLSPYQTWMESLG